jgi:hypothetical protein
MSSAKDILDRQFLEMRWRCLSLAADLDRIERAAGSADVMDCDSRLKDLRKGLEILLKGKTNRAEQFLMLFSDMTPPPPRNPKSKI